MDLHVHIGRTYKGNPVKITASDNLTLKNILDEAMSKKGIDIIGIIDAQSPEVIIEINELITSGEAYELIGGGIRYKDKVTLILGSEVEIYDENCSGPVHLLCYFPNIEIMKTFSNWCQGFMKNIHLSSQRLYCSGRELQLKVKALGGWFIPAHIFTPFKSLYGKGVEISLTEVFDKDKIDAVELGLSSDTIMAEMLIELNRLPFLTNSDAHSLPKIGREHQLVLIDSPTFSEIDKAIKNEEGRRIEKNVGLNPRLGKYYLTTCKICGAYIKDCTCVSGHNKIIKGVSERISELAEEQRTQLNSELRQNVHKHPPYIHQVPLEFIPGCGPKTIKKLIEAFGSEMAVLHEISQQQLQEIIPDRIVHNIVKARTGKLLFVEGGGGTYGKVKK